MKLNKQVLEILKFLYHKTYLGKIIIQELINSYNFLWQRLASDEKYIKKRFEESFGRHIDLDNPQTLNEKINWLKLNDRTSIHTQCADKFAVRSYIKEKIGEEYLIPLHFHTEDPEEIVIENLPDTPCIIKANHDSGGVVIVKDKHRLDYSEVRKFLRKRLKRNYYWRSKEWQYKNIKPQIIIEKLLQDSEGNIPFDYKFHCFNGKLLFTQVDLDRQSNHTRNLYDVDWNFIPCEWKYKNGRQVDKPETYEKMKNLAEKIAQDFVYVRVDFYTLNRNVFFGEITFHTESGFGKFKPFKFDLEFGKELRLTNSIPKKDTTGGKNPK